MTLSNARARTARGALAMFIAVAAFSFMDALLKSFSTHYPPLQVSALRALASIPFILLPLWWQGRLRELQPVRWELHLLRGVLGIAMLGTFVFALREASLASVYSVYMGAPLLIAAMAAFLLGERVGVRQWIAIGIGFVGVLVILQPRSDGLPLVAGLGTVISALCYAAAAITARVLTRSEHSAAIVLSFLVVVAVGATLLSLGSWTPIQAEDWLALACVGVTGAIGQHYITTAFRDAPAATVAPIEYTALLWGAGIDWVVWQATPASNVFAGATLVVAAGLYVALYGQTGAASTPDQAREDRA